MKTNIQSLALVSFWGVGLILAGCDTGTGDNEPGENNGSIITVSTVEQLRTEYNSGNKVIKLTAGDYEINTNTGWYALVSSNLTLLPPDLGIAHIYAGASKNTSVFFAGEGAVLTVGTAETTAGSIIIDGARKERAHDNFLGADGALIGAFGAGAKIIIHNGVSLMNNTWHAVQIGSGSIFEMKGGLIDGNRCGEGGAGVHVTSGGTFIMEGGTISNNAAWTSGANGGGVYVSGHNGIRASFIMKGGMIRKNTAGRNGGGVYVNSLGDFLIEHGTIKGYHATDGDSNSAGVSHTDGAALYIESGSTAKDGNGTPFTQSTNLTIEK